MALRAHSQAVFVFAVASSCKILLGIPSYPDTPSVMKFRKNIEIQPFILKRG